MEKQKKTITGSAQKDEKGTTHACCYGKGQSHFFDGHPGVKKAYQCMMKCEGAKTYNAPGICPDCNMNLALVD